MHSDILIVRSNVREISIGYSKCLSNILIGSCVYTSWLALFGKSMWLMSQMILACMCMNYSNPILWRGKQRPVPFDGVSPWMTQTKCHCFVPGLYCQGFLDIKIILMQRRGWDTRMQSGLSFAHHLGFI